MRQIAPLVLALVAASLVAGCASDEAAVAHKPPVEENRSHAHEMADRMKTAVDEERDEQDAKIDAMLEGSTAEPSESTDKP